MTDLPLNPALVAIAISTLVCYFIYRYYVAPASIARKLRQHGLHVLPYRPLTGNVSEIRRLQVQAQLSHLSSPAAHHQVPARIQPFYTKILSESKGRKFVYWWGHQPRLVITDPEDVKQIMSDLKSYTKSKSFSKAFHRLFGYGLLLAEGADWHNQRTILRPAFFSEKLKAMVGDMHVAALEMTEAWREVVESSGGKSAEVEAARDLKNATADILARTSFGSDYRAGKAVFENQDKLLQLLHTKFVAHAMIPAYRYLPTPNNLKCWKIESSINKELSRIVHSRLMSSPTSAPLRRQTDLLSLILANKLVDDDQVKSAGSNIPLTTIQIIDECKTFFFAGHETTAHLLAWTMMLLSLHQEWQEKLRDEALEVCGRNGPEPPETEQLNKLKLMGMVLNESLRLYPPVPAVTPRVRSKGGDSTKCSTELGQLSLLDGMAYSIPTILIQRDTSLWGPDAHEFRPERFRDGVSKASAHPSAFLPFGFGPRICIGQSFALLEAKIILVAILQRFHFCLSPNYKHAPITLITMKPKHGMQIILELL